MYHLTFSSAELDFYINSTTATECSILEELFCHLPLLLTCNTLPEFSDKTVKAVKDGKSILVQHVTMFHCCSSLLKRFGHLTVTGVILGHANSRFVLCFQEVLGSPRILWWALVWVALQSKGAVSFLDILFCCTNLQSRASTKSPNFCPLLHMFCGNKENQHSFFFSSLLFCPFNTTTL